MPSAEIRFLPEDKVLALAEPVPLSDAAAQADVLIDHPCGSNATCGKCRVRFVSGAPEPTEPERRLLTATDMDQGWRLSCQCLVSASAVVEVPSVSRVASPKGFGSDILFPDGFEPVVRRRTVMLPEPTLEYQWALEDSLAMQWGQGFHARSPLALLRALPALAPEGGAVTAVFDHHDLLDLAEGSGDGAPMFGLAFDVGSTSLAGALVNLETGAVAASSSMLNPQVRFGGDVISRIEFAMSNKDGNAQLHAVLVQAVNSLIRDLAREAEIPADHIWTACFAGNPAMLHTLMGVDVVPLGQAPYVGAWSRGLCVPAGELGLAIRPGARMRTLPMIRSNVGADTVGAVLASGMDQGDGLSLMIDLGTNSEIVLGHRGRMLATSTAAGPAFEGANIRQGMRAAPGAIDRVTLRSGGRLGVRVLGGVRAKGICGSGLIDAVAALLRTGLIDETGRMHHRDAVDSARFPELASRVVEGEHGHSCVILAGPGEADRGVPVMLNALDVRQLQLIKGSILAGMQILLTQWGATPADLDRVLIAGAFGSYVRKTSLLDIGLVPPVDPEKVEFIGNAAGVGARMALLDRVCWRRAESIRERTEYVELGGHPEYPDAFAEAMGFFDSPAIESLYE